jgi:hypothetical protein
VPRFIDKILRKPTTRTDAHSSMRTPGSVPLLALATTAALVHGAARGAEPGTAEGELKA